MEEALKGHEDALDNTVGVAGLCEYEMSFGEYKFPMFQVPEDQSLNDMLTRDAEKGLVRRLAEKEDEGSPLSRRG